VRIQDGQHRFAPRCRRFAYKTFMTSMAGYLNPALVSHVAFASSHVDHRSGYSPWLNGGAAVQKIRQTQWRTSRVVIAPPKETPNLHNAKAFMDTFDGLHDHAARIAKATRARLIQHANGRRAVINDMLDSAEDALDVWSGSRDRSLAPIEGLDMEPQRNTGFFGKLPVKGNLPRDIIGAFIRVAPNPYLPLKRERHAFDGDGALAVFRIKNGSVFFSWEWSVPLAMSLVVKRR
jgi:hypothetical protein